MAVANENVIFENREGIALITLNMPERLNALSIGLTGDLLKILNKIEDSGDIRAVVITGSGNGFCAGGDLREFAKEDNKIEYLRDLIDILNLCVVSIRRMAQPVIAAVSGAASGAGMSLVLTCDLAVADETSLFNMAYVKIGVSPDGGGSLVLAKTLGLKKATDLIFSGRMLSAKEALNMGIVNQVVPAGEALNRALAMAEDLAKGPSLAFAASKRLINSALFSELETHLEKEKRTFLELGKTKDFSEGLEAFLEKRRPLFKGE